jgi:hypothetical protein
MDAAQPVAADAAGLPATVRPVGVSGAEYRRQWNKLNKARIRKSQREWYKNHPEKHKKFPKSVRDKWRPLNKKKHRARYYSDWEKAVNRTTRWTTDETNTLLSFTGTDRELAAVLGRSVGAIQLRRHALKRGTTETPPKPEP